MNRTTKPYRYADIYTGGPKGTKPSLDDWYVYYFFENPKTKKLKRFQVKDGINRLESITERMAKAKHMVRVIDRALDDGFNPFLEVEDREFLSVEAAVKWAMSKKRLTPETKYIYMGIVRVFYKAMGDRLKGDVKKFTRLGGREALDLMVDMKKLGDKAWNRYKEVLHIVFTELTEYEKIMVNPFDIRRKKLPPKDKARMITPEQGDRIREHLSKNIPGYYLFLLMTNMTAIRPSELLKLKPDNFEITERNGEEMWYIHLNAKDVKDKEARTVVVPIRLREMIKPYLIEGHYLFGDRCEPQIRKSPKPYISLRGYWDSWVVKDLGITGIRPYSLKHLGIRSMLAIMPEKAVQYQAGHSSKSMTDVYSGKDATIYEKDLEKFKGDF